jgi:2-succinyl-5-enolpyruvyl-6-hydroxy-3-cyclohexene-1-carboxylate synthase
MTARPEDVQATFAATLVDEWVRWGLAHAVVAPGSRSTPLALALARHPSLTIHVHHDERGAGYLALGLALATGLPAIVLTTSGTAAVELHPAVVEADLARVPMIVCTADRPPELQDVGAPQAIDQTRLFGTAVRWFTSPGVPQLGTRRRWRSLAARSVVACRGPVPGPVHLNLAFREPLVGQVVDLEPTGPAEASDGARRPNAQRLAEPEVALVHELRGRRGLFVAGAGSGPGRTLDALARALGWPVIASPQAPVWGVPGAVVPAADSLLRTDWVGGPLRPEVVVRLGMPLASKVVGEWVARTGALEVVASGPARWTDPLGTADLVLPVEAATLVTAWAAEVANPGPEDVPVAGGAWRDAWEEAATTAMVAIDGAIAREGGLTEPGLAQELMAALPEDCELVVSSSMPVRDLEWYAHPRAGVRVHANRGANGIDGVVSTAVGVALAGRPTALLIGDVALLHDLSGLVGAAHRGIDLVIVVVDNDGGGIFSFLPQAGVLDVDLFEHVFATPHGLDLVAVAAALGAQARSVDDVGPALRSAMRAGGVHVLVAQTDRAANVEVHERLHAAVSSVLERER